MHPIYIPIPEDFMVSYIAKRLGISLIIIFIVTVFSFSIIHILPGDPARIALGEEADQAAVDALRAEMNLDKPIITQYVLWMKGILQGDFGMSIVEHRPVGQIISERLPKTISLGIPALCLSVSLGLIAGIVSAIRRGKFADQFVTLFTTLAVGTPEFWLGVFGIFIFGLRLHVLPIQGYTAPGADFEQFVRKAIMPVVCLAIHLIASIARHTRANLLEVINQDYVRTARANGIPEGNVIFRHSLKNALIPVITMIALQVRVVLGGSIVVEQVFNITGIGLLLKTAVGNRDYLIIQGCVLILSMITVGCNFIVDILYGVVDPRIRESWR